MLPRHTLCFFRDDRGRDKLSSALVPITRWEHLRGWAWVMWWPVAPQDAEIPTGLPDWRSGMVLTEGWEAAEKSKDDRCPYPEACSVWSVRFMGDAILQDSLGANLSSSQKDSTRENTPCSWEHSLSQPPGVHRCVPPPASVAFLTTQSLAFPSSPMAVTLQPPFLASLLPNLEMLCVQSLSPDSLLHFLQTFLSGSLWYYAGSPKIMWWENLPHRI